jgi:hypothetical protein
MEQRTIQLSCRLVGDLISFLFFLSQHQHQHCSVVRALYTTPEPEPAPLRGAQD